ncbi:15-cis-phytoene synthase [Rhodovulum adriaticum]|uniref:Phytoene synthase n=1 Tax=Rhodovulum adriaticum TaxID=35804 RepID=A0A4R2NZP2_RHOAD|nr:phytoene/squalene synthase family protein [Rhodovulum adriaticum]MBK1636754.1 phytoene synthase [Rhodovulum adriaticum]TCP27682.1 phytoene synthase [Rhodovulum adriaticum]
MIDPADLEHCKASIRTGSYSFHAASRLLPGRVRDPALALYAFCRLTDDAVDLTHEKTEAVLMLGERLDAIYRGQPRNTPTDRAFAAVVEDFEMPRTLPEALLEGMAWDAMEKRYHTLSDVYAYSARVAAAVGVMMTVLMRVRCPHALARACDLGVAMQLTNIARDVGEDARARRIYLPLDWLAQAGIDIEAFFDNPRPTREIRKLTRRLIADANRLYFRSEPGVAALPFACRPGIFAARNIYGGIGREVARRHYDSINTRAYTTKGQKIGWLIQSTLETLVVSVMPRSAVLYGKPLPECAYLVEAAAERLPSDNPWGEGRAGELIAVLAQLEAKRRQAQPVAALVEERKRAI